MNYPGSKAASGVAERIIRQIPPHRTFIEAFAGSAAIWRKMLPSEQTVLIDCDAKCCHRLRSYIASRGGDAAATVIQGDALEILPSLPAVQASDTIVYIDAPYLRQVRSGKALYDFEFWTPAKHEQLLGYARELPCKVLISHYKHPLYAKKLKHWEMIEIPAMTRGGPRIECLWRNYPEPATLHDPRWAGGDFRERERIKRKGQRWTAKFLAMEPRERQAIAAALIAVDRSSVEAAMRSATPAPTIAAASVSLDDGRP